MVATGASAQNITAAGATFPYPIYNKWFTEYNQLHPNVKINYQSIGSGGGIKQVSEGTVDFGASEGEGDAHPDRVGLGRSGIQHPRREQGPELHRRRDRGHLPGQDHQVE
jgi:hypothetical protein